MFSNSVAAGLKLFAQREKDKMVKEFEGCEATIDFTLKINNLFDAMNRSHTKEGIKQNSADIEVRFLLFCRNILFKFS